MGNKNLKLHFTTYLHQEQGNGIESHGLGGYRIFNNIIVNAGRTFLPNNLNLMKHGIFLIEVSAQNDSSFIILHNNIINPKSDGIRFSSIKSKKNVIASNVIINPGNFDFYEKGNTHFKGNDAYIMLPNSKSEVDIRNNYLERNANSVGFIGANMELPEDFKLGSGSPLINAADPESSIPFDYASFSRPFGSRSDIGAYEFDSTYSGSNQLSSNELKFFLQENPVKENLKICFEKAIGFEFKLRIYNVNGILVKHIPNSELFVGFQNIQVNISDLSSGFYVLTLENEKHLYSDKFIKY
jgi:hypothetical protein